MTQEQLNREYNGLRPAYSDEFLPPIARSLKIGGFILLGLLSAVIALAATVKYSVAINTEGAVVQQKARRTGQMPSLKIKAYIAAQDFHRVAVGQTVQLRVNACPYPDYGMLQGKVQSLSSHEVSIAPRNARETAQPSYFEVMIQPTTTSLARRGLLEFEDANRACSMRAGMKVKASILAREETILEYVMHRNGWS
jgi:HlyD family secretion protein